MLQAARQGHIQVGPSGGQAVRQACVLATVTHLCLRCAASQTRWQFCMPGTARAGAGARWTAQTRWPTPWVSGPADSRRSLGPAPRGSAALPLLPSLAADPVFPSPLACTYNFERLQPMRVVIFDVDTKARDNKMLKLNDQDFLGGWISLLLAVTLTAARPALPEHSALRADSCMRCPGCSPGPVSSV